MQIREISLKELTVVYENIKELYPYITYKEFEDLIYDMRYMDYKMFGIFEKEDLITFSGVCIHTTLKDRRHLVVYEFITSNQYDKIKYNAIMKEYLEDFAKVAMCESVKYTGEKVEN